MLKSMKLSIKTLLAVSLFSTSLAATSVQAAPSETVEKRLINQEFVQPNAKIQDITINVGQTFKLKKGAYYKNENPQVVSITMWEVMGKRKGKAIVRVYDKNDNEIAAYRFTVTDYI